MAHVGCHPVWYMKLLAKDIHREYEKMCIERHSKKQNYKTKILKAINEVYTNINGTN